MINKTIILNIFSTNAPFKITISNPNGIVIFSRTINQNNKKLCICSKFSKITIKATYNTQSQTQYLYLNKCKWQYFNINFIFNEIDATQNFILLDKNYGLPIKTASLTLKKVIK